MAYRDRSWPPADHPMARPHRNVGDVERWISAAAGAALVAWAIQRRRHDAWWIGAGSAMLLYRASTGHCPFYEATGVSTAEETSTRRALSGPRGVHVEQSVTINKPVDELYAFWRNLENLPRVMSHLQLVDVTGEGRSRWVAKAPAGRTVEWYAEIINDVPNKVIGWRSIEGSEVVNAGSVNFDPQPGDRGTIVRVHLQYEPPGGKLGSWIAWLFGEEPSIQVRDDLRRFKQLLETGEVATAEGQPRGGLS
jgi:uncharacterized membrane protein